jgi:hypothetical protein
MRLGFLQNVYAQPGPFATVVLDTSAEAEDAGKAVDLRWRTARERLAEKGADDAVLRAIDDAVGEHREQAGRRGQVIVANADGVVFTDELPDRPANLADDEWAYFGDLPHLLPYLRMRGARIPYVQALVDHQGADIAVVNAERREAVTQVEGDTQQQLHKPTAGGRGNERRHQHAVEERWKHNAAEAAEEISKRAAAIGAEAIVLAGDVQQRKLVREQIRRGLQPLVVDTDASHRDRKASDESLQGEVAETISDALRARVADTVESFERERGEQARAVEGWQDTVAALQREQVDTALRIVAAGTDPRELAIGPAANQVALDEAELKSMGAEDIRRVPADAALIRALAGTDANLVLPEPDTVRLTDGVGATLRYIDT